MNGGWLGRRWMEGCSDGRTDARMDGCLGRTDARVDGRSDDEGRRTWRDNVMGGRVLGWTDGRRGGWAERWMGE